MKIKVTEKLPRDAPGAGAGGGDAGPGAGTGAGASVASVVVANKQKDTNIFRQHL